MWRMAGHRAASIGTLGVTTSDETVATGLTTPDIVTFLANVSGLAREGVSHLAYEASSHGLRSSAAKACRWPPGHSPTSAATTSTITPTMEDYFAAKMRLFDEVVCDGGAAVIWADDAWSARAIAHAERRGLELMTVGEAGTAIRLLSRKPTQLGQTLEIEYEGTAARIELPLIGAYQAANALVAAGLVLATGGASSATFDAMARLQPVRGRLERAAISPAGAPIYVDYAHTPDALEAAIAALRPHAKARVIVVFGAGGDRDPGKRPEMGRAAADPCRSRHRHRRQPARRGSCRDPRDGARRGNWRARNCRPPRRHCRRRLPKPGRDDIVLIAGKGHEQGQIVGRGEATCACLPSTTSPLPANVPPRRQGNTDERFPPHS